MGKGASWYAARMTNMRTFLHASLLSLTLLTTHQHAALADAGDGAGESAADAPLYSGSYKVAATEAEKAARQKSVDATVSEFFALTRPIARGRIEKKTHISDWVTIKQNTSNVVIQFEGRGVETCPFKGSSKGKDPEGNEAEFAAEWQGSKLVQTVKTEEGKRTNTFALQADGSLKLSVELRSTKFKTPVHYTVSYAKK